MNSKNSSVGRLGQIVTIAGFQVLVVLALAAGGTCQAIGGWTVYSGNVYQKTIALPVTGYRERMTDNATLLANQVFVGGKMMIDARWPNVANPDDWLNRADFRPVPKGGWTTDAGTTLRDAGIPDIAGGWTGGTIWFIGWFIPQTSTITASSAGQIQFPSKAEEKFHDSCYLTGRLGALDAEKEWFYDGTKLYLWAPGGGRPANVEVKQRNYAFDLSGKSNITIKSLGVFAATITRNAIYRTGRSGIDGVYSNKDIEYNDIYDFGLINTDLGAIYAANGTDLSGSRIHHNWLHDAKNDASHPFPVGAGIYFDQNAKPAQVDHNVFWNNHKNDVRLEQGTAPFHRVFNNTMASTETTFWYSFHSYPASSPSNSQNNIYRLSIKPDTPGSNEMTSGMDPKFANAGEGGLKYRLQPDSPAIDRAAVIEGVTDGHVGSAPDLGAYEYGGPDWVAGCSTNAKIR